MRRPIIGITGHFYEPHPKNRFITQNKPINQNQSTNLNKFIQYFTNYIAAVQKTNAVPYLMPFVDKKRELAAHFKIMDGLILTGGGGLPAEVNKKKNLPSLREQNPARYDFEKKLLLFAIKMKLPVLGICRGHQMIGEVFGGEVKNLNKRLIKKHNQTLPGNQPVHKVTINKKSWLYRSLNQETIVTNSFHRQIVHKMPLGFKVSCYSGKKIIEGIEHETLPLFGLQFHPEKHLREKNNQNIFEYFVKQCCNYHRFRKLINNWKRFSSSY